MNEKRVSAGVSIYEVLIIKTSRIPDLSDIRRNDELKLGWIIFKFFELLRLKFKTTATREPERIVSFNKLIPPIGLSDSNQHFG